jgi:hypothetical protein
MYEPSLWIKPFNYSIGMGYKQKTNIPVYLSKETDEHNYLFVKTENKKIIVPFENIFSVNPGPISIH